MTREKSFEMRRFVTGIFMVFVAAMMAITSIPLISLSGATTVYASQAQHTAQFVVVARSGVNRRAEPNNNARILGTLSRGTVITIDASGNGFARLTSHGGGWVAIPHIVASTLPTLNQK